MARNREYELKFAIDPADVERVVSHRLIRPGLRDRQIGRLVSTYFDTPDKVLQRHRFGLRVRRSDDHVTHTLKQTGSSLVDRGEWERTDDDPRPNVVWMRQTPLKQLLRDEAVAKALGPRFSVDVARTTLLLRYRKARIELALDQGMIGADGVSLPLSEMELEIKRGRPEAVLDLARRLARDLPMVLSLASKSERGYGLADLTWGSPSEAIRPALKKNMSMAAAFEAMVQCCLHVFLKNTALIGGEVDGDAVHKARIALRHLRAVCELFRPMLRRRRFKALRGDIKWLSDRFGAARDADVFQSSFYDWAARDGEMPGAHALAVIMSKHRARAHERLEKALASARARLLFIDILAFAADGIRRSVRDNRFRPYAKDALRCRRRTLARRARGLSQHSVEAMHGVRKHAKMLRYDLSLVAAVPRLASGAKMRKLKRRLKVLQKSLGVINDEAAMRGHLRETILSRRAGPAMSSEQRRAVFAAAQLAARPSSHATHVREAEKAARRL